MSKKRSRWTVADARTALSKLDASGLSVSEFSEREGLDAQRFHRWRRRFSAENERVDVTATPALIELRPLRRAEPIEISLASGITLRVAETVDPSALARLIAELR